MGVAVFSGMIGVTVFGLFLTPVFYVLLRTVTGLKPLTNHSASVATDRAAPEPRDRAAPEPEDGSPPEPFDPS